MARVKRDDPDADVTVRLMLDSGAFTAWSKGEEINLTEYIQYIKDNKELIHTCVNLDVIPGMPNKRATPEQVEESARLSYVNLKKMHKAGLKPIPVFHMGERFYWLDRLMSEGEEYIGISPATEAGPNEIRQWLDSVFTHITDEDGVASIKTHGFGVASFDILKRYPWHTADATSWALTAAYGGVFIPVYRAGKPDFSLTPVKLTVSEVDRKNGLPPDHYLRYGPFMKDRVTDFLNNYVGITVDQATHGDAVYETIDGKKTLVSGDEDYVYRAQAVVYFYMQFQKAIGDVRFKHRAHEFGK